MKNFQLNYESKSDVIRYINGDVVPSVYEILVDSYYDGDAENIDDYASDYVFEIIDAMGDVIYNYQAQKIAEAFLYDPFNSESEMTGERFNSWNEMSFEIIYNKFYQEYGDLLNA